jgi:hypothetical protein
VGSILPFEHHSGGPLTTYVIRSGDDDIREPLWPGLWELDYPTDRALNPYFRFGINNGDGEHLAVWRAAAWALLRQFSVSCIPMYYRDQTAAMFGIDPADIVLVEWEYDFDTEAPSFEEADRGFVPGRSCVPIRPQPSQFERDNAARAGVFEIRSFADLTSVEVAVSGDASSEVVLFGLRSERRREELVAGLHSPVPPTLSELMLDGEWFIDLSVVRDRFLGTFSHFTARSSDPGMPEQLTRVAAHFDRAWERYSNEVADIRDFDQFARAIERLLEPPV